MHVSDTACLPAFVDLIFLNSSLSLFSFTLSLPPSSHSFCCICFSSSFLSLFFFPFFLSPVILPFRPLFTLLPTSFFIPLLLLPFFIPHFPIRPSLFPFPPFLPTSHLAFPHAARMSGSKSIVSHSSMRKMNLVVLKKLQSVGSGKGRTVSPKIVVHW